MPPLPPALLLPLQAWLDEEQDEACLRAAAAWAGGNVFDVAVLFDWLHAYPATRERRARAELLLRDALGLPLIPGAVCRVPAR